ncbi:MAG: Ig-like domain-containing protein [Bacteroidales bacterium]|nr:Ig-like domain-containing protein [Bacteroidales bacterium]
MKRKFLLFFLFIATSIFSATLITSCSAEDDNEVKEIIFSNVNNGKVTLDEGEEFVVKYIINPSSLQDVAKIAWETTNKSVARVRNGKITAYGEGTATISAYSGNATASVKVVVNPVAVTSFNLPSTVNAYKNQRVKVDVTNIQPENGSIASIEWKIADEDVATLEIDGGELYVTALKDGSTTLTGIAENCKKSCNIVVKEYIAVSSISVSLSKSSIVVGETTTISASVLPNNASVKDVTWSFSPSSLVEFSEQSLTVKGVRSGNVTVRATSVDGVIGEKTLTITPPVLQLSIEKDDEGNTSSSFNIICPDQSVGKFKSSLQLILSCNDTEIDIEDAVWKSSNESVATVNSNGLVTAKGHGFSDISATINGTTVNFRVRSVKSSGFKFSVANPNDFKTSTTSIATPRKKVNTRYIDEVFKNDTEIYNMADFWDKVGQSFSASSSNSNLISVVNTGEVDVLYLKADAPGSSTISISPKYGSSINVAVKMSFESMTFIGVNTGKVYGTVQNNGTINITQTGTSESIYAYCNAGSSYDSNSSCLIYRDLDYDITWTSDNKSRKHPFYSDYLFYTGTYNNLTTSSFGTFNCNLTLTKN